MADLLGFGRVRAGTVGVPVALTVLVSSLVPDMSQVTAASFRVFFDTDTDDAVGVAWTATKAVQSDGSLLVKHTLVGGDIPLRPAKLFIYPELTVTGLASPVRTPDPFVLHVDDNNQA